MTYNYGKKKFDLNLGLFQGRNPPCPGKMFEKSLILYKRFNAEKDKTPICDTNGIKRPPTNTSGIHASLNTNTINNVDKIHDIKIPPMDPSIVFLGEMRSFNLCLPKQKPIKYAPISVKQDTQTIKIMKK